MKKVIALGGVQNWWRCSKDGVLRVCVQTVLRRIMTGIKA